MWYCSVPKCSHCLYRHDQSSRHACCCCWLINNCHPPSSSTKSLMFACSRNSIYKVNAMAITSSWNCYMYRSRGHVAPVAIQSPHHSRPVCNLQLYPRVRLAPTAPSDAKKSIRRCCSTTFCCLRSTHVIITVVVHSVACLVKLISRCKSCRTRADNGNFFACAYTFLRWVGVYPTFP